MGKGFCEAIYYYLYHGDLCKNDVTSFNFFLNLIKLYRDMFCIYIKNRVFDKYDSFIIIYYNLDRFKDLDTKLNK